MVGFAEKGIGGPGLINAGCYVLPKAILVDFPRRETFSLEIDFLATEVSKRHFDLFVTSGRFH